MTEEIGTCRVLIIAGHRAPLEKVASLLNDENSNTDLSPSALVTVQYLPCVATFGSYNNEFDEEVRYLCSVDYYGPSGSFKRPETLVRFFDDSLDHDDAVKGHKRGPLFTGVTAAAVGGGIENEDDVQRIASFLETISSRKIPVEVLRPNPEFASMKDELAAYRDLDEEAKQRVTESRTMGPGKMAKFTADFAKRLIDNALKERQEVIPPDKVLAGQENGTDGKAVESVIEIDPPARREIDTGKDRFLCRMCRTVLFGQDDLQDPAHEPSRHSFSVRKQGSISFAQGCQSIFLQDSVDWMGNMDSNEGKFSCPSCSTKLGHWNWSGDQCSCGTWVVPSIMVPKSKVDIASPRPAEPEPPSLGTTSSPTDTV